MNLNSSWKVSGLRECRYVYDYVSRKKDWPELKRGLEKIDYKKSESHIPKELENWVGVNSNNADDINEMFSRMSNDLLDMSYFEWIDENNDRMLFFLWYQIVRNRKSEERGKGRRSEPRPKKNFIYNKEYSDAMRPFMKKKKEKENSEDTVENQQQDKSEMLRYQYRDLLCGGGILKNKIIAHFDLNVDGDKEEALEYLKEDWNKAFRQLPDVKWFREDYEIQADWCMDYIQKKKRNLLIRGLAPVSREEKTSVIIGSLDAAALNNRFHPAELELFINKMKGAWGSKKNRSNEKKNMNHRVSPEAFKKFNDLCEQQFLSKSMMLEKLIAQEYERTRKKR